VAATVLAVLTMASVYAMDSANRAMMPLAKDRRRRNRRPYAGPAVLFVVRWLPEQGESRSIVKVTILAGSVLATWGASRQTSQFSRSGAARASAGNSRLNPP
jgi:hypothetical protein